VQSGRDRSSAHLHSASPTHMLSSGWTSPIVGVDFGIVGEARRRHLVAAGKIETELAGALPEAKSTI
jgi:hypothetical protein